MKKYTTVEIELRDLDRCGFIKIAFRKDTVDLLNLELSVLVVGDTLAEI